MSSSPSHSRTDTGETSTTAITTVSTITAADTSDRLLAPTQQQILLELKKILLTLNQINASLLESRALCNPQLSQSSRNSSLIACAQEAVSISKGIFTEVLGNEEGEHGKKQDEEKGYSEEEEERRRRVVVVREGREEKQDQGKGSQLAEKTRRNHENNDSDSDEEMRF